MIQNAHQKTIGSISAERKWLQHRQIGEYNKTITDIKNNGGITVDENKSKKLKPGAKTKLLIREAQGQTRKKKDKPAQARVKEKAEKLKADGKTDRK
jgi:regulator of replication initiation timing